MKYWNGDALMAIGGVAKPCLGVDENFLNEKLGTNARVVVMVDLAEGVVDEVLLMTTNGKWSQKVVIDHYVAECKFLSKRMMMVGASKYDLNVPEPK